MEENVSEIFMTCELCLSAVSLISSLPLELLNMLNTAAYKCYIK